MEFCSVMGYPYIMNKDAFPNLILVDEMPYLGKLQHMLSTSLYASCLVGYLQA